MDDRTRNIRLGLLMLLAALGLLGGMGALVWNKLVENKDIYFVRYQESVSGLEVGTTVRMHGVNVGQIQRIEIAAHVEGVIVTLALHPGTPITVDTRATLTPLGITGLKYVELSGGSARAARILPNSKQSVIRPGASAVRMLMTRGSRIVAKAEQLQANLTQLGDKLRTSRSKQLGQNAAKLLTSATRIKHDNDARLRRISSRIDNLTRAMKGASMAIGQLGKSVEQQLPETRQAVLVAIDALEHALGELKLGETERSIEQALAAVKRRSTALDLKVTTQNFAAASQQLAQVSERFAGSLTRHDAKWLDVRRNLREAGRFIGQLQRRLSR